MQRGEWREAIEPRILRLVWRKVAPDFAQNDVALGWRLGLRLGGVWGCGGVPLFVAAGAGHEVFDGGERVFALMQDGVDLFGDGHFDVMALGQR